MQNQEVYDKVVAAFAAKFGANPAVVAYAPGRIEVLGNHTDYNEGYVFSAAIDKGTFFAVSPAADDKVTLVALDMDETYETTLGEVKKVASGATWANYPLGTLLDHFFGLFRLMFVVRRLGLIVLLLRPLFHLLHLTLSLSLGPRRPVRRTRRKEQQEAQQHD